MWEKVITSVDYDLRDCIFITVSYYNLASVPASSDHQILFVIIFRFPIFSTTQKFLVLKTKTLLYIFWLSLAQKDVQLYHQHLFTRKKLVNNLWFEWLSELLKLFSSVMLKVNASKHKSETQKSQKPLGFSKNAHTKSFFEFYLVYIRFPSKQLR